MENTKMPNGRDEMTEEFAQEHQPLRAEDAGIKIGLLCDTMPAFMTRLCKVLSE